MFWAPQEHLSTGQVIWDMETCSGATGGGSWASQTWSPSSNSAPDLLWRPGWWWLWPAKLPSLLLRFFFFPGLIWVLTMQPSIPAGQGRQAACGVCPAGGGGLWQPVPWLLASSRPVVLLSRDVICSSHLISNLSHSLGWGCHPLCWLDWETALSPFWWTMVIQFLLGRRLWDFSSPARPCPKLSFRPADKELPPRTGQKRNWDPNTAWPKEGGNDQQTSHLNQYNS